jgi:hypothetical protein
MTKMMSVQFFVIYAITQEPNGGLQISTYNTHAYKSQQKSEMNKNNTMQFSSWQGGGGGSSSSKMKKEKKGHFTNLCP